MRIKQLACASLSSPSILFLYIGIMWGLKGETIKLLSFTCATLGASTNTYFLNSVISKVHAITLPNAYCQFVVMLRIKIAAKAAILFGCMEQSGMTFLQFMTELAHFFESSMSLKERGYKWGYIFY